VVGLFTRLLLLLLAGFSFLKGPFLLTQKLLPLQDASLPLLLAKQSKVSVIDLAPSILLTSKMVFVFARFQHLKPRRVRYYALFKGCLLLRQPPRCFRFETTFAALSRYSGTLTLVWVWNCEIVTS